MWSHGRIVTVIILESVTRTCNLLLIMLFLVLFVEVTQIQNINYNPEVYLAHCYGLRVTLKSCPRSPKQQYYDKGTNLMNE